MFFPFSFSISLSLTPVIIIIAVSEMCSVCVPPPLGKPVAGDGGRGVFVENISLFVHGDGTAVRLRKMALLSSS